MIKGCKSTNRQSCSSIYNHISLASVLTTSRQLLPAYTGQPDFSIPSSTHLTGRAVCAADTEAELWLSFAEILQECIADVSTRNPVYQSRSCRHLPLQKFSPWSYVPNSQKKFQNHSLVKTSSGSVAHHLHNPNCSEGRKRVLA